MPPRQGLDWETDGADWPLRQYSRFVDTPRLRWHVQYAPHADAQAPTVLLLHGTGASTHSWRDVFPLLGARYSVLALDFPGHAFSAVPAPADVASLFSLPGMAAGVAQVLAQMGIVPHTIVGHSAGAAVACMLSLDGHVQPQRIVSLNGALLPLDGLAGQLFSPMAKLLAKAPFVPELFSWQAGQPAVLQRLLDGTGSRLDAQGRALYQKLIAQPAHSAGALAMMAHWDLHTFWKRLPALETPLTLIAGEQDLIVPPSVSERAAASLKRQPPPPVNRLSGLGHLAHEEQPDTLAQCILHAVG
ncbi:MAG: alpha/beta fold hydrolase [Rhodoferax sp.]|nr:alpha/beta fold hydrolase [Rhodoferax sp.]